MDLTTRIVKLAGSLVASLWVGVLFCVGFVVAPYLFALAAAESAAVPNTGVAADLIGPLLSGCDVASMIVGVGLILVLVFLRRRGVVPVAASVRLAEALLGVAVAGAAVNYFVLTPRVMNVKARLAERYGAYHLADKTDELYAEFGSLHGTSTVLFVLGFLAALTCLSLLRFRGPESPRG